MFRWLFLLFAFQVAAAPYNLSVCAIFKNEAPYLKEWIEYHQLIGVDHFFLYNNGSIDSFKSVLNPYVKKKIVTLIQWPDQLGPLAVNREFTWSLSTQLSAYENALKWTGRDKTKWLIFLDIDEFLVAPQDQTVAEILEKYDAYPGVTLTTECYDASHPVTLPGRKLVIEATEMIAPPEKSVYRAVKKTILKPALCTAFLWPPYECLFKNEAKAIQVGRGVLRINEYENRMRFKKIDQIRKKIPSAADLPEEEKARYLKEGFIVEDPEGAITRYVPDLYKKMGYSAVP